MKKTVILAALGLIAAATANGQGTIVFSSYVSNGGAGNLTYYYFGTTTPIGTPFTAMLYYANGTVTDPVNNSNPASIGSLVSSSFTLVAGSATAYDNSGAATGTQGLGYFDGPTLTIPIAGYNGTTPVSFEIVAFAGSSYASSAFRGRSGAWTESSITQLGNPAGNMGDHGTVPVFYIDSLSPMPEPGALALAGLGGLAALIAVRRKRT